MKHQHAFGDVSVLPTTAFYYGLAVGEEISVSIEEGKILIIRLISVSAPDKDSRRTISYELNGIAREAFVIDKSVAPRPAPARRPTSPTKPRSPPPSRA